MKAMEVSWARGEIELLEPPKSAALYQIPGYIAPRRTRHKEPPPAEEEAARPEVCNLGTVFIGLLMLWQVWVLPRRVQM